jgi:hypothetical protein
MRSGRKAILGGLAGVLGAAAIRIAHALPLTEAAEPEHEYPSRKAKKKDSKKMGSGPRTRRKKEKKGK